MAIGERGNFNYHQDMSIPTQLSETSKSTEYPVSVAPMMDCTDRHYRFMMRFLTRKTLLYTEMVTTGAILFGDKPRHLDFSKEELPLAPQLGGDDPKALAECAGLAQQWGVHRSEHQRGLSERPRQKRTVRCHADGSA